MSIATILKAALAADTAINALVSGRIYPVQLPQSVTYPAISYQRISSTGTNGNTAMRESRYQISCWAETYLGGLTLAAAVKALAEGYTNTASTPGIKMTQIVNELDDYDDSARVYRVIVDVIFTTTGD